MDAGLIIGISGVAGSGKDTTADVLVRQHGFVKVAMADPLKRICKDVYDFSNDQLWGPSSMRNAPDWRYARTPEALAFLSGLQAKLIGGGTEDFTEAFIEEAVIHFGEDVSKHYLTAREALQSLGTEWGRHRYENTWIEKGLRTAKALLGDRGHTLAYDARRGLHEAEPHESIHHMVTRGGFVEQKWGGTQKARGVAIPDVRFKNEMLGIRAAGGVVIRVRRAKAGLSAGFAAHASEAEQLDVPDSFFDYVAINDGPLEELPPNVLSMLETLRSRSRK